MSKLTARIKPLRQKPGKHVALRPAVNPLVVTKENRHDIIRQVVTPMHIMPYEEQLRKKEQYCRNALRLLSSNLIQSGTRIRVDVRRLPCPVQKIVPSPLTQGYRNKDEFSIWRGFDSQPTVGFFAFPISDTGDTVCVEPQEIEIVRDSHKRMNKLLNDYLRTQARVGISYDLGKEGGWRRFIVRSNVQGELMLIGQLNPRTFNIQQMMDEKKRFNDFILDKIEVMDLDLKSIYVQQCPHTRCSHRQVPFELLYGQSRLNERVNEFKIFISPDTFLQQNTSAAEMLYKSILEAIEITNETQNRKHDLIVDACTGNGLIAMHLSKLARQVVAIDNSDLSIDDARSNAHENRVKNIDFIVSNIEVVMERVLEKYAERKEALVVCNPPRQGMHPSAVQAIRESQQVQRIVYISCKPDGGAMDNFIQLCQRNPPGKHLPPFIPILAIPVDMFPHTEHCEMIIVFERLDE